MISLPVKSTALVLIDLQKGILAQALAPHTAEQVVAHAKKLVDTFREQGGIVVLVHVDFGRDGGLRPAGLVDQPMKASPPPADWADFHPALEKDPRDVIILKRNWGAFHGTELDTQLRRRGITTIVLGGVATSFGVEQTAREAWQHNYSVVIAEDASAAPTAELHEFSVTKLLPRIARIRKTAEIISGLT
jgi:nicotinamidase-related amidase